jgi:hypothetical protein
VKTPLVRAFGIAALAGLACGDAGLCENSSPVEIPSPDAKRTAWVFIRECGPATPSGVHVSILPAGTPAPADAGNTFGLEPVAELTVKWAAPDELAISRKAGGHVLAQEPRVGEVAVTYAVD